MKKSANQLNTAHHTNHNSKTYIMLSFVKNRKGGSNLLDQAGYEYRLRRAIPAKDRTYWHCVANRLKRCPTTAITVTSNITLVKRFRSQQRVVGTMGPMANLTLPHIWISPPPQITITAEIRCSKKKLGVQSFLVFKKEIRCSVILGVQKRNKVFKKEIMCSVILGVQKRNYVFKK